ncbi:HNH endonuclease [Thomasclavelia ramosa]|uniref:HNH endonuclease n=1 Tax=Thomasclavelia ramosa TaxID=1547 RepID=UPI000E472B26|nr:HNH endonuclease [Thomasclavelia ramosa]RHF42625.1 HNH endonuclease [Thomasclavelia ramosa]
MFDYYGGKWKKKRNSILRKDKYKCQITKWFGRTEEANTVHHIYPVKDYPEYAWCDWNLISVSNKSHNKLENRKTGELTPLGKWLMQKTVPGVEWRKNNGS